MFPKFYNGGGVWTLAGALPIFNRINFRRGCFMKKSFQRVIATLNLFQGKQSLTIFILAAFFALSACDDSSSASGDNNETSAVESSSSISTDKEKSSDSKTKQSNSSGEEQNSSNTEKMSSSSQKTGMNDKSSSSVNGGGASSSSFVTNCKVVCSEECEGTIKWRDITTQVVCRKGAWLNIDSLEALSSSSYFDTTKVFNPDIEYGSHTDSRDGRVYRTVTIKLKYELNGRNSITVFAENLNYGKMITGGNTQSDSTKFCFDDDPWYCEHGFGGFYTWSNAMKFPSVCDSVSLGTEQCSNTFSFPSEVNSEEQPLFVKHQGLCDDGWHVMSAAEWLDLVELNNGGTGFYNRFGSAALAYSHLLPDNRSGFSLLPTGFYDFSKKMYKDRELYAYHWLPQEKASTTANYFSVSSSDYTRSYWGLKGGWALPIRCVKDY